MGVPVGKLRHYIEILAPVRSVSTTGKRTTTYPTVADRAWAEISPVNREEAFQYSYLQDKTSHIIRCRYTAALKPDVRIQWGARALHVSRVRNIDERNIWMEAVAWEVHEGE